MGDIKQCGFLSDQITQWTHENLCEYEEYYTLCKDVNFSAQKTMQNLQIDSKCLPEILVAMLLSRGLSSFQAIILLSKRGMVDECNVILRCLLENEFALLAIAKDAKIAEELVVADDRKRRDVLKACQRNAKAGVSFFQQHEVKEELQRLEEEIEIKSENKPIKKASSKQFVGICLG